MRWSIEDMDRGYTRFRLLVLALLMGFGLFAGATAAVKGVWVLVGLSLFLATCAAVMAWALIRTLDSP